ncbi:hypothetical protein ABK040_011937 [Willaertia magna]
MSTIHKSGGLHQENKKHKNKHTSKRQLKKDKGGKVEKSSFKSSSVSKTLNKSKDQRRNTLKQIRDAKKQQILFKQRFGKSGNPPRIVAILSLGSTNPNNIYGDATSLFKDIISKSEQAEQGKINLNEIDNSEVYTIKLLKEYQQKTISLFCVQRQLRSVLDAAKIADILLLVIPAELQTLDDESKHFIKLLSSQGLPSTLVVLQNLQNIGNAKKQNDLKNEMSKIVKEEIPETERVYTYQSLNEDKTELKQILLRLNTLTPKTLHWRDQHPYMLVDNYEFQLKNNFEDDVVDDESEKNGTLIIRGFLRGKSTSPNQLFQLVNYGSYQLDKIVHLNKKKKEESDMPIAEDEDKKEEEETNELLPNEHQESLQSCLEPNFMEGEQTWPTNEDFEEQLRQSIAEKQSGYVLKKKKVPKGMTPIEAAWLEDYLEDFEEEGEQEDEEEMEDEMIKEANKQQMENEEEETHSHFQFDVATEVQTRVDKYFNFERDEDMTEEERIAEMEREMKRREELGNEIEYPDEVETPMDAPARIRFQKYRGLKSFRTSPWDPEENLPLDYSRIFRFKNFHVSQKVALQGFDPENENELWENYIELHLVNVPFSIIKIIEEKKEPLIAFGLLKHEQKMSVIHLLVKRTIEDEENDSAPIKSKDELIVQVGFRTFKCNPIYSEHNPRNDKHKFEKFFIPGRFLIATIYAPITFKPSPVLMFRKSATIASSLDFVAHGTVFSIDPYRCVIKKIILTGHPYKIHKNQVVVRYMFFNPEDVRWFKPVEIYTKYGRHGVIKESIGTHGLMRCQFDQNVEPKDTICMNLYKRTYPKWTTETFSLLSTNNESNGIVSGNVNTSSTNGLSGFVLDKKPVDEEELVMIEE